MFFDMQGPQAGGSGAVQQGPQPPPNQYGVAPDASVRERISLPPGGGGRAGGSITGAGDDPRSVLPG
jgi:hypothetical protein